MMDVVIDNWPMLAATIAVVAALWFARRSGVAKGVKIGRTEVLCEYYAKKEGRL